MIDGKEVTSFMTEDSGLILRVNIKHHLIQQIREAVLQEVNTRIISAARNNNSGISMFLPRLDRDIVHSVLEDLEALDFEATYANQYLTIKWGR